MLVGLVRTFFYGGRLEVLLDKYPMKFSIWIVIIDQLNRQIHKMRNTAIQLLHLRLDSLK